MLKICELFVAIEGETEYIGLPIIFVRTQGCNLRCSFCDTKYAQNGGGKEVHSYTVLDVVKMVQKYSLKSGGITLVCLTGGEPLDQKESLALVAELTREGFKVIVETNGSKNIKEYSQIKDCIIAMDIKTPSSGMKNMMKFSNCKYLRPQDQLKFIIDDKKDYEYAKDMVKTYHKYGQVIFTPVGGLELKWLMEKVLEDKLTEVRILPQLHKWAYPPNKRGV